MKFFERYFPDVDFDGRDRVKVLCPFHGDTVASAVVNVDDNSFHCFACKAHYTEQQFMAKVNNIDLGEAGKVLEKLETQQSDWHLVQRAELWANATLLEAARNLGLSDDTISELNLGLVQDKAGNTRLGYPVFFNGVLMDVRAYNVLKIPNVPKMLGEKGAEVGLILPYDIWKKTTDKTYIFEGEKDMSAAFDMGLNAITLTGGASVSPNDLIIGSFENRDIVICYDNDEAGREGAKKLYSKIRNTARSVKYIDIAEVAPEEKGDFYDAVHKHDINIFDFLALEEHEFDDALIEEDEYVAVQNALRQNRIKRPLKSLITVNADFSDTYAVPVSVTFKKVEGDKNATMVAGEERSWYLSNKNIGTLLDLIEVGAKTKEVMGKIRGLVGIPANEAYVSYHVGEYRTVYKVRIMDANARIVLNADDEHSNLTLDLYTYTPMSVGAQYAVDYIIFPHPTKNQKLVAVALSTREINAEDSFRVRPELLKPFAVDLSVEDKVEYLYNSAKHHIAKHLNKDLWLMSDLVFNSILEFDYGDKIRGALDIFILGDTQVGKSETTSKLTELYNFGHFLSLKTSTTVGLIGGSQKVDNAMLNTIGAIPRQHKKLVVLEEFSGAPPSFIKTMTDIRTSGQIRITRIAGELRVPCRLRTITISNPINDDQGNPRYLSTFPHGVAPLMELIGSAEDVARYDGFLLVPRIRTRFNPFYHPLEGTPIPKESYEHKMQWVYTRKAENVKMSEEIKAYIWERAEELNNDFESNFPIFGTTAPLKLARFSVALASLLLNSNETYEDVVVTEEIVDFVVDYLRRIYDNDVFKLKEYKREHDEYNLATKEEVNDLQKLYTKHSVLLEFILTTTKTTAMTLRVTSGLDGDKFNPVFARLVKHKFIRLYGQYVEPTAKFRSAMSEIDKSFTTDTGTMSVERPGLTYKIGDD